MESSLITVVLATAGRCRAALALVAVLMLASCGSRAPGQLATEYLDERTAATITTVGEPIILFSEDPARAANARDYIYAAPLAVNHSGKRSWWLWLGLWSTIDRGVTGGRGGGEARIADVAGVLLIVDGEPMDLDMGASVPSIPGVGHLPYATPVASAKNIFLPLTGSQVTRLSHAGSILARTEMAGGEVLLWQRWAGSSGGSDFAELATTVPAPRP